MLILPDTSCWVEFLRRHGDVRIRDQLLRWLDAGRLGICGPIRAEVLRDAMVAHKDAHFDAIARVLPVRVHSFLSP